MIDIQHIWSRPTRAHGMRQTTPSSKSRTLALLQSFPIIDAFRFRHAAVVCARERNVCITLDVPVSFLAGEVTCCGLITSFVTTGIEDDLSAGFSLCHLTCAFVIIQFIELFLGHCARLHCKTQVRERHVVADFPPVPIWPQPVRADWG